MRHLEKVQFLELTTLNESERNNGTVEGGNALIHKLHIEKCSLFVGDIAYVYQQVLELLKDIN